MTFDTFRRICLEKPGVTEGFPFGEDALVFKVGAKMFATLSMKREPTDANLKCDPERSIALREQFAGVSPGFHMNKKHWNTLVLDGDVPGALFRELIQHSYDLVYKSLPAGERKALNEPDS